MQFPERVKLIVLAIVHIFETSKPFGEFDAYVVLDDGAGVSYGLNQFTHRSGSLLAVIEKYIEKGGTVGTNYFKQILDTLRKKTPKFINQLAADKTFKSNLLKAAKTPEMREAQTAIAQTKYFQKALVACAGSNFVLPMSLAVVYDSINHGSYDKIRDRNSQKRKYFSSDLDFEKAWITEYVRDRDEWLESVPRLKKTDYRTDFFLAQLARKNWQLNLPMNVHGYQLTEKQFKFSTDLQPAPVTPSKTAYKSVENPPNQIEEIQIETAENTSRATGQSKTENGGGGKIESLIDSAKGQIGAQINTVVEEATDRIQDSVKAAVEEAKDSAKEKAVDYVTQKLPNFAKTARWLKGFSFFGIFSFIAAYLEGLPWYVLLLSGYVTGVASTALVVFLLYKTHKIAVITEKVTEANADPLQNNIKLVQLPPSPGIWTKIYQRFFQSKECDLSINS